MNYQAKQRSRLYHFVGGMDLRMFLDSLDSHDLFLYLILIVGWKRWDFSFGKQKQRIMATVRNQIMQIVIPTKC